MRRRSPQGSVVIAFALLLAFGLAVAAHAAAMVAAAVATSMDEGACTPCGGEIDDAAAAPCRRLCGVSACLALQAGGVPVLPLSAVPACPDRDGARGLEPSPEPGPPKL